jgi:hypothetical protein
MIIKALPRCVVSADEPNFAPLEAPVQGEQVPGEIRPCVVHFHQSLCVFLRRVTGWIQPVPLASIHRGAWKGYSQTSNFRFTAFQEARTAVI